MSHGAKEANIITAAAALICGIDCAGATEPDVERWANVGFGVLAGRARLRRRGRPS